MSFKTMEILAFSENSFKASRNVQALKEIENLLFEQGTAKQAPKLTNEHNAWTITFIGQFLKHKFWILRESENLSCSPRKYTPGKVKLSFNSFLIWIAHLAGKKNLFRSMDSLYCFFKVINEFFEPS
ncbi:MAG: hypothetical protein HQM08_28255 [Candidatus Riflebacteria bacterium]|nr:hypothetical protein [Candidatus Riflebacteria bacterium]